MSLKDIITKRVLSTEEAAQVWAVSNKVALATHAMVFIVGVVIGHYLKAHGF